MRVVLSSYIWRCALMTGRAGSNLRTTTDAAAPADRARVFWVIILLVAADLALLYPSFPSFGLELILSVQAGCRVHASLILVQNISSHVPSPLPLPHTTMAPSIVERTMTPSLSTTVAGIRLPKILLNSPNPRATSVENLMDIASSTATGAFTTRTACPNFEHDDAKHQWREWGMPGSAGSTTKSMVGEGGNTINCLGYSCHTFEYYGEAIQTVQKIIPDKPAFYSISGYAHEIAEMLKAAGERFQATPDKVLMEINLSCPNIPGKPPIAYDFVGMKEYLTTVFANGCHGLKVGVKLTPYFYDGQFVEAAAVLNEFHPHLAFVTCINTVGCGLVIDTETEAPILADASGASYGGLGGPAVHATALGNVRRMRQLLREEIDVVGCGGVDSGAAAFSHLLCGAQAVMVASALLIQGVDVFTKIENELKEIMASKGYTSIHDFRGKLKDGNNNKVCGAAAR